ncbi:hypothetical protein MTO96_038616 [Rhipicephalus appendiculatus]
MGQLENLEFGLAASVGDVDFFPNGGSEQPGCRRIACSHQRAHELMIESITNHGCIFVSRPVSGKRGRIAAGINMDSRSLHESGFTRRGAMGYDSINAKGRGMQYLRTRSKPPFCIPWKEYIPDDDDISPPLDDHMPELFQSTMTLKGRSLEFSFMFCAIFVALGILACVVAVLTVVNTGESFDEDEPTDKGKDGGESEPRVSARPVWRRGASPRNPLICTVSVKFTSTSTLPRDGLCDIIFYESFYTKNKPTGWTDPGLDHFLELATKLRATSIGASFSP